MSDYVGWIEVPGQPASRLGYTGSRWESVWKVDTVAELARGLNFEQDHRERPYTPTPWADAIKWAADQLDGYTVGQLPPEPYNIPGVVY